MLQRFLAGVLPFAQALGGPGLALLAFLDSSFLSFPEVTDALIVVLVVARPHLWFYYGALPTLGSMAGCLALFLLARKGGEAFLRRWVSERMLTRWFGFFRSYGLFSVVLASLMPPPVPFKPFVILAGVSGVTTPVFLLTVFIGRGTRYIGEAWLAKAYGAEAMAYLAQHFGPAMLWLAAALVVAGAGYLVWKAAASRYNRDPAA
jgi:membrane protein YqaA with SNARE-associated domain